MSMPLDLDFPLESVVGEHEIWLKHVMARNPSEVNEAEEIRQLVLGKIENHIERTKQSHTEFMKGLQVLEAEKMHDAEDNMDLPCEEAELQSAGQRARQELEVMKERRKQLDNQLSETVAQVDTMLLEREEAEETDARSRDTRRYHENLLRKVTGVQFDDQALGSKIQGFSSLNGDVKPFDFDLVKNSSFFIANSVWETVYMLNST